MLILICIIGILLSIGSAVIYYLAFTRHSDELSNNRKRINTWWGIFIISLAIICSGGVAITLFALVLVLISMAELSQLFGAKKDYFEYLLVLVIAMSCMWYLVSSESLMLVYLLPVGVLVCMVFWLKQGVSQDRVLRWFAQLLCAFSILSIPYFQLFSHKVNAESGFLLLYLFFITASNDICQYMFGKALGRRKLVLELSPNKTVEGAVGGVFGSVILSVAILPIATDLNYLQACFSGMVISVSGILGDLTVSSLKRRAKVKDTGTWLSGHGGLLDRVDSLILTIPGFGIFLSVV